MMVQIAQHGWVETAHIAYINLRDVDDRMAVEFTMSNGTLLTPPVTFSDEHYALKWLQRKGIVQTTTTSHHNFGK